MCPQHKCWQVPYKATHEKLSKNPFFQLRGIHRPCQNIGILRPVGDRDYSDFVGLTASPEPPLETGDAALTGPAARGVHRSHLRWPRSEARAPNRAVGVFLLFVVLQGLGRGGGSRKKHQVISWTFEFDGLSLAFRSDACYTAYDLRL